MTTDAAGGDTTEPAADANADDPSQLVTGRALPGYLVDVGDDWFSLIAASWHIAAGAEGYLCARATVPRDTYIHEFSALASPGTHHALVLVDEPAAHQDGASACEVDRSGRQIFDSNDFTAGVVGHMQLPDGVAMQIRAGQQLLLNLHLLNAGSERLAGTSGIRVRTLPAEQVVNVAATQLVGPHQLQIPPGSVTKQVRCTWPNAATVFGVAPHMHELGSYMKVVTNTARGETVLLDSRYSFDWQHVYVTDSIELQAGDQVVIECTYQNASPIAVGFGEGAHDEMCFAAMSMFPALDEPPVCTE